MNANALGQPLVGRVQGNPDLRNRLNDMFTRVDGRNGGDGTLSDMEQETVRSLVQYVDSFCDMVLRPHKDRVEELATRLGFNGFGEGQVGGWQARQEWYRELMAEVRVLSSFLFVDQYGGAFTIRWRRGTRVPVGVSWGNLQYLFQTYSMMVAMVACVAFFVGGMMGIFLFVMSNTVSTPMAQLDHSKRLTAASLVIVLPVLLFVGSLCILNCVCLLAGQASGVSFARCRALMLCSFLKSSSRELSWDAMTRENKLETVAAACSKTDEWFSEWFYGLIGICSALGAIMFAWKQGPMSSLFDLAFKLTSDLWGGAMCGTFMWGMFTICRHIGCDLHVGNNPELRNAIGSVQAALIKYDIRPGIMRMHAKRILEWLEHDIVLPLQHFHREHQGLKQDLLNFCRHMRRALAPGGEWVRPHLVVPTLVIPALVILLFILPSSRRWNRETSQVQLVLVILWILTFMSFLTYLFSRAFPKLMSCPFLTTVVALGCLLDLFMSAGLEPSPLFHGKPTPVPLPPHGPGAWIFENLASRANTPYPACRMRWGAHNELRVLDLAILSSYSYDPDDGSYSAGGDVWTNTSASFTGQGIQAEVIQAQNYWTVGRVVVFRFKHEGSSRGTTVLVVKGSSEAFDFYADAGLWAMIAGFQAFMVIIPLLDQLPNQLFTFLLDWLPRTRVEKHIFKNIRENYTALSRQFANDTFLITGHSLGGGIAIAAGGSLGIPSISFSGPGSHFSRWRFGTTEERAYRTGLDVKPEIDIVHKIDRHDEMGQYIVCRDETGAHRDSGTCHMIGTTICELWRACGDHRQRDFRPMCRQLLPDGPRRNGQYITG